MKANDRTNLGKSFGNVTVFMSFKLGSAMTCTNLGK